MDKFDSELKAIWDEIRSSGRVHKRFLSWPIFYSWAFKQFSPGAKLVMKDESGLYSPENCCFQGGSEEERDEESETAGWDRTVDAIRQLFGFPPLPMGDPCPGCPNAERCEKNDTVCATRLRYWDATMARLKTAKAEEVKHER